MGILSYTIPVPASGLGPSVDVSTLVGPKTVQLSGLFAGRYNLLASHDDVRFDPVLTFDAGGEAEVEQVLEGTYRSFRIESRAAASGTVTCHVSGVGGAGENFFLTVAGVGAGFSGLSPIVDTAPAILPSGSEEATCFLARGAFQGTLVVLGSVDGVVFNPVGSWKVDRLPEGSPTDLEFAPLQTLDKTRYVRVQLVGTATGPLVVTMGGRVPLTTSVTLTLAQAYASGTIAFDQTLALLDAKGGTVVFDGTSPSFTGAYAVVVRGNLQVEGARDLAVGVATPTARVHVAAGTASAGTAPLKIPSGTLLGATEAGAVEADANHLYWTNGGGTRLQLDDAAVTLTLAGAYANGSVAADQTLVLLDSKGGGVVVNATTPALFTGVTALEVDVIGGSVNFYRVGGFDVQSSVTRATAPGTIWDEVSFLASTITLTGGPATATALAMVRVGSGVVNGAGNAATDAYDLLVDAAPTGTATLTRSWSAGFAGAVQAQAGVVLGAGLNPPAEGDLVVGAGATVVSQANSGRLGYLAGATQKFMVSQNGAAYVPLLTSVTLAQSYAYGSAAADQTLALLDAKGGGFIVDGTSGSFTGANTLAVNGAASGAVLFPRVGGMSVLSSVSVTAAPGAAWDEVSLQSSTITLTGGPATATSIAMVHVGSGVVNGAGNTATDAYDLLVDAAPTGTATLTRSWSAGFAGAVQAQAGLVLGAGLNPPAESDLVVGTGATVVSQANTGRLGYVAGATQKFMVSQNGGAYFPLVATLNQAYVNGTSITDQTITLEDARGGGVVVAGTSGTFTGTYGLTVTATSAGSVLFPRVGGMSVLSNITIPAAVSFSWNQVEFKASTLTLTGGPFTSSSVVSMVRVRSGTITGALANVVNDAYGLYVEGVTSDGGATIVRPWAAGFADPVQMKMGLVLGTGLAPPGENDLVFGAGATTLSQASSGIIGYLAGGTQAFMVSANGGAYVPLLYGPAAGGFAQGSVPFGIVGGQLGQDNANFFWDNINKGLGVGATPTATLHVVQPVVNAAVPTALLVVGGAHTAITAGTEDVGANFNFSATKTWATGALTTQREVVIRAPTYAFAAASTITTAATVAISGAPSTGANCTITNSLSLWVQQGNACFSLGVGIGSGSTVKSPSAPLYVSNNVGTAFDATSAQSSVAGCLVYVDNPNTTASRFAQVLLRTSANVGSGYVRLVNLGIDSNSAAFVVCTSSGGSMNSRLYVDPNGNLAVGTGLTPDATSTLHVVATQSVVAAAGAAWNGINLAASTLTLTGATTPVTTINFTKIAGPTVTAASAVVTTDFYTCRIGAATFVGAGPASATRSWSLGVDGNAKFGGGLTVHSTDVNAAGPYVVLATDFVLCVRYTATGVINLNLPAISTVGDGRLVVAVDSGYNAAANPITWVPSGADKINNIAGNYVQNVTGSTIWLKSNSATSNWEIV